MPDIADFYARLSSDPLTMAFEEEKKSLPSLERRPLSQPEWTGGCFADFGAEAFMARAERPLALYIHVPYCHHHCTFCPFYINQTKKDFSADYSKWLLKEIADTAHVLREVIDKRVVDAIYFGGGTPSDLDQEDMASVITALYDHFKVAPHAEVTVEGRTTGFTAEKGKAWVSAGANRFSLGVQAANTVLRKRLGRISSREEVGAALNGLCESGASVVIDLLYGLPGQDVPILLEDIRYLSEETDIDGLDLYELKCFPDSPLDKAIRLGKMPPMPALIEKARLFGAAYDTLQAYGFEHFSPKHWRRNPRERSLYNRLAGQQADMIPFGSAAGGRLGTIGLGNARDMATYTEMVKKGEKPLSRITSSPLAVDKGGFVYQLDRAMENLHLPDIDEWPATHRDSGRKLLAQWTQAGLLAEDAGGITLTCAGHFWSGYLKKRLLAFIATSSAC